MPQRNVATNFTFEQQRLEINLLAQDFWTQKGAVDTAAGTYLQKDGSNSFTGATLAVPNAFTINSNSGAGTVTIAGNLQVDGTTTTLNSTTLEIADKNIVLAKGSANDAAADGAGITVDSDTDKTFNFVDADDAFVSSIGLKGTTGTFSGNLTVDSDTAKLQLGTSQDLQIFHNGTGNLSTIYNSHSNGLAVRSNVIMLQNAAGDHDYLTTENELGVTLFYDNQPKLKTQSNGVTFGDSASDILVIAGQTLYRNGNNGAGFHFTTGSIYPTDNAGTNNTGLTNLGGSSNKFGTLYSALVNSDTVNAGLLNCDGNVSNTTQFSGYGGLRIHNANGSTHGITADMYFTVGTGTTNRGAAIGVEYESGNSGNDLYFATNPGAVTNSDTLIERMRIESDGKVSINTEATQGQLNILNSQDFSKASVSNNTDNIWLISDATSGDDVYGASIGFSRVQYADRRAAAIASVQTSADEDHVGLAFFTHDNADASQDIVESLRIKHDGKVGIGHHSGSQISHELTIRPENDGGISIKRPGDTTSSPNTHLEITTTTAGNAFPSGEAYTVKYKTYNADQIFETYAGGGTGGNISFRTSTSHNSNESLRITPDSHVLPGADNTQDLGSSTMRWANVYTGDMHLNNMNSGGNEVDGTEGHWTMQEGADDLFLINRNTGKRYKFNLTEV